MFRRHVYGKMEIFLEKPLTMIESIPSHVGVDLFFC